MHRVSNSALADGALLTMRRAGSPGFLIAGADCEADLFSAVQLAFGIVSPVL